LSKRYSSNISNIDISSSSNSSSGGYDNVDSGIKDSLPLYIDTFKCSSKDIHDAQEGGYANIDDSDINKYFPEGFAGEIEEEFNFTNNKSWMIRSASKLLCRIIEDFEDSNNLPSPGLCSKITYPNLTDRKEWSTSLLRVRHYGTDLINVTSANTISNELVITKGKGSIQEMCLDEIRKVSKDSMRKIMLTGPRGSGKSTVLNQMVYHARSRGWLCLFIPNGWLHVQGGSYIEPAIDGKKKGNKIYNNPLMSADMLRGFWKSHKDDLRKLPIAKKDSLKKYESYIAKFNEEWARVKSVPGRENSSFIELRKIAEGENDNLEDEDKLDEVVLNKFNWESFQPKTLEDMILLGIALRDLSGNIAMDLIAELKDLESMKVLIAVDQYNSWEVDSAYSYRNEKVHSRQLCIPYALNFLSKKKSITDQFVMKNGICVAAVSNRYPEARHETFENVGRSIPLLINIPTYSQVEYLSSLSNYLHHGRIDAGIDNHEALTFRMYTNSNPLEMRKMAVPFFFPLSVGKHDGDWMQFSKEDSNDNDNIKSKELVDGDDDDLEDEEEA